MLLATEEEACILWNMFWKIKNIVFKIKIFCFILPPDFELTACKSSQETHFYYFKGKFKFKSTIHSWLYVRKGVFKTF